MKYDNFRQSKWLFFSWSFRYKAHLIFFPFNADDARDNYKPGKKSPPEGELRKNVLPGASVINNTPRKVTNHHTFKQG